MENPTGESNDGPLHLDFDRRVKLEFHGSRMGAFRAEAGGQPCWESQNESI